MIRILPLALAAVVLAHDLQADEHVVPGDFPTIQAALDFAATGDSIRVLPGTYAELLEFRGEDVRLFSDSGPAVTVLDGNGSGPIVRFATGEGRGAVLEGFRIENGAGQTSVDGGGVEVVSSSPTVRGNAFSANTGGAVGIVWGSPLIVDNQFVENSGGAILLVSSEAHVLENTFADNSEGALNAFSSSGVVERNTFVGNGNGGTGGAVYLSGSAMLVRENSFIGNSSLLGGAISCGDAVGAMIARNDFQGNVGGFGGAIHVVGSSAGLAIESNTFTDNAAGSGGGLYFSVPGGAGPILRGNTFFDNSATNGAALFAATLAPGPRVSSNVFSEPDMQLPVFCDGGSGSEFPEFLNNCAWAAGAPVWGGDSPDYTGVDGNIEADPLFVGAPNGDFGLQSDSPCLDAGEAAWLPLGLDLAGNPRLIDGDLDGAMFPDMGALERNNVFLAAEGDLVPGGDVTLEVTGIDGGFALLVFGELRPRSVFSPFGPVFLERNGAWQILGAGTLPLSIGHTLPGTTDVPVAYQAILRKGSVLGGNVSNPIVVGE